MKSKGVFIVKKMFSKADSYVLNTVTALHSRANNIIVHLITMMGNAGIFWWILSVPFFISKEYRQTGLNILMSMFLGLMIGEVIIKNIVGRTRPSELLEQDELIIRSPRHSSFPSGHTSTSISVAVGLMINCTVIFWLPALIVAILISFSRVYLRVHYFSDVCGGVVVGVICGIASKFASDAICMIPFLQPIFG